MPCARPGWSTSGSATEATKLLRGGSPGDESAALEVRTRATGASETLSGPALVAADGAASLIRGELGIELEGAKELLAHRELLLPRRHRAAPRRSQGRAVLRLQRAGDRRAPATRRGGPLAVPDQRVAPEEWSLDVFTHERARDWIRAAVGVEELEPEVLSLGLWKLNATVAERFVQGRVLLCGDAAHQFPPTGRPRREHRPAGHAQRHVEARVVRARPGRMGARRDLRDGAARGGAADHEPVAAELDQRAAASMPRRRSAEPQGSLTAGAGGRRIASLRQPPRRRVRQRATSRAPSSPTARSRRRSPTATPTIVPSATPGARAPHVWLGRPRRAAVDARPVRERVHAARRARRRCLVHGRRRRSSASSAFRSIATASAGRGFATRGGFTRGVRAGRGRRRARPARRTRRLAQRCGAGRRRGTARCGRAARRARRCAVVPELERRVVEIRVVTAPGGVPTCVPVRRPSTRSRAGDAARSRRAPAGGSPARRTPPRWRAGRDRPADWRG